MLYQDAASPREDFEGVEGASTDEESIVRKYLMKFLAVFGIASVPQSDSVEHDEHVETQAMESDIPENANSSSKSTLDSGTSNEDLSTGKTEEGLMNRKEKEEHGKPKVTRKYREKKSSVRLFAKTRTGKSDPYFIALFWLFLISRVWSHAWILQFIPIFICIYLAKALILWLKTPDVLSVRYVHFIGKCKHWIDERKDAISPGPVRAIYKLLLKGDKKV